MLRTFVNWKGKDVFWIGINRKPQKGRFQSATPVVYPLILKILQSERLKQLIEIEELKIWEETEKHLGWITSGKADISFSAIVASSKLYTQGQDIKLLSVEVWDNFTYLPEDIRRIRLVI